MQRKEGIKWIDIIHVKAADSLKQLLAVTSGQVKKKLCRLLLLLQILSRNCYRKWESRAKTLIANWFEH